MILSKIRIHHNGLAAVHIGYFAVNISSAAIGLAYQKLRVEFQLRTEMGLLSKALLLRCVGVI